MNPLEKFKAGSIIQYPDGKLDYLIFIPNENGLWVNACNPEWGDKDVNALAKSVILFL